MWRFFRHLHIPEGMHWRNSLTDVRFRRLPGGSQSISDHVGRVRLAPFFRLTICLPDITSLPRCFQPSAFAQRSYERLADAVTSFAIDLHP
jgi:hypothetical protein